MKLYELTSTYAVLLGRLQSEAAFSEESLAVADTLSGIEGALSDKIDQCCRIRATLRAEAEAFKQEAERLTDRRRALENRAESLESYIFACMEGAGIDALKGDIFSVKVVNNPESVVVDDMGTIPDCFKVIEVRPDKLAIKAAIKGGQTVLGARLDRTRGLRIR